MALIFGGVNVDGKTKIYRTDPGGQYFSYKAVAIGMGDSYVNDFFEKNYRDDMSISEMIKLAIKAVFNSRVKGGEEKREDLVDNIHAMLEISYISVEDRRFRKLSIDEVKKYVGEIRDELLSGGQ